MILPHHAKELRNAIQWPWGLARDPPTSKLLQSYPAHSLSIAQPVAEAVHPTSSCQQRDA